MATWPQSTDIAGLGRALPARTHGKIGLVSLLCTVLFASSAVANSRAPLVVPALPSTAPRAVSEDVVIEHEALTFRCDKVRCKVKAAYRVRAGAPQQVELRFVVPIKAPVTARFGTSDGTVSFARADALQAEIEENISLNYPDRVVPPIYEATVVGPLSAGLNEVSFEYVQPLGGEGRDKATESQYFNYGLWPLREWKRAKGFTLDFTATLQRPEPTWWQRWFGSVREMACWISDDFGVKPPAFPVRHTQRGNVLWLQASVPLARIPDAVNCLVADDLDVEDFESR